MRGSLGLLAILIFMSIFMYVGVVSGMDLSFMVVVTVLAGVVLAAVFPGQGGLEAVVGTYTIEGYITVAGTTTAVGATEAEMVVAPVEMAAASRTAYRTSTRWSS